MSKEETKYTTSAKVDRIRDFLENSKEYRDIISAFIPRPGGVFSFNPLANDIIFQFFYEDPEEFLVWLKAALILIIDSWSGEKKAEDAKQFLTVQISDSNEIKMHDWDASYEGIPVAVNCQVIAAMAEETYTKKAMVFCSTCHKSHTVTTLNRLPRCTNKECENYRVEMEIARASLKTGPIRTVLIQEPLEEAKFGTPKILPCVIKDSDVKNTFVGQRKRIIGIFRSEPQKFKSTNSIKIHAISTHNLDYVRPILPTKEQRHQFEQMAEKTDYISILQNSYAPEIKYGGSELAKLSLIFSVLGGNKTGRLRGLIHTFLVGNPSTAKSKMLEFIPLVAQNSGFAVGGTSTGSGITVTMDTLPNRQKIARTGLIPNCTGGCAAIDEMNQLEPEDLGKMFEAMESCRIHYEKGGIKLDAIAETAIQGGANPKGYYYDKNKTIVENINMPGPLLQRFDLKVNLLDNASPDEEKKIRKHILLIRSIGAEKHVQNNALLNPQEQLILFNHAKTFKPTMTPKAEELIENFDSMIRELPQAEGSLVFDRRTFEAIGRLVTAHAKLHFSKTVEPEHAMTAIEINKKTLETFNMNVRGEDVPVLEEKEKKPDEAFVSIFKQLQQIHNMVFLDGVTVIQAMTRRYPKLWKTPTAAEKFFETKKKDGTLTRRQDRYNLE